MTGLSSKTWSRTLSSWSAAAVAWSSSSFQCVYSWTTYSAFAVAAAVPDPPALAEAVAAADAGQFAAAE